MNRFESKNSSLREAARAGYHSAATVSGARLLLKESSRIKPEQRFIKPASFNGLLTNKLLTALPGEDFARLLPYLEPVSLAFGEELYEMGNPIRSVYFPETAVISHMHLLADGSTAEAAMIGREGLVGISAIFDTNPPAYWSQVMIAGSALRTSTEAIKREFARGGALQRLLLSYTGARLTQLSQRAVCNGRHRVEERLCSWLLMVQDRAGDAQLTFTHDQIARHLGTRRAGITSAANALRENRIISYIRGQIRILDRERLEAAACECYQTLRRCL
jgi:CRP-like cAMP-binding protein